MGDVRTSLPQNAFKQHIGIDLSSASAHSIFYIVAPSTLISHGAFYRDAFRPNFVFCMSIIFHTHIPFQNLLFLITCGDYEAQYCAFLFAPPSLSVPHFFSSLFSDTFHKILCFIDQNSHTVICIMTICSLARYYTYVSKEYTASFFTHGVTTHKNMNPQRVLLQVDPGLLVAGKEVASSNSTVVCYETYLS